MIGSIGIDAYRNDFNLYPLYFWRNGESPDRQGMTEIKYVMGLYDFFDTLQREHPRLLLDTCASGGRRIDFEMLRRALVLTRSDYLWDPIGQQCHTYGLAQWIPITGIGSDSPDRYKCRSGLGSHFVLAADFYSKDPAVWEAIARAVKEHRSVRRFYTGDFYPLGSYSTATRRVDGLAVPSSRPGRRTGPGISAARQPGGRRDLSAVRIGAGRRVRRDEPGRSDSLCRMTGRELMERGLTIDLPDRPAAALYTYRNVATR